MRTDRAPARLGVDFERVNTRPSLPSVALATALALAGSLGADAVLVAIGTKLFPSTRGFSHFRFDDYATLTAVGVVVACLAWPLCAQVSSTPRRLYFRAAVVVTLVLWLPDVWILLRGEPPKGVGVLMVMHLAVAVVTYNLVVRVSPARSSRATSVRKASRPARESKTSLAERRAVWFAMLGLVCAETVLGVLCLVAVPFGRPSGWIPSSGAAIYLSHSVVGGLLGVGGAVLLAVARRRSRPVRISAIVGFVGIVLGAGGGLVSADHRLRLLSVALMFAGAMVGATGYLLAVIELGPDPELAPGPSSSQRI